MNMQDKMDIMKLETKLASRGLAPLFRPIALMF